MKFLVILLFTLIAFSITAKAQLINSPTRTVKKFVNALAKADYEKAYSYCVMDAKKFVERYTKRGEIIEITTISCDIIKTDLGVNCECLSIAKGKTSVMIYEMTEIDGHWKIYNLDNKRATKEQLESTHPKSKSTKNKTPKSVSSPVIEIEKFVKYNAEKNYKKASQLTMLDARLAYNEMVIKTPNLLPIAVKDISCFETNPTTMSCACLQTNTDGKVEGASYELTLVDKRWKIYEIHTGEAAEFITRKFVAALALGSCELAKKYTTGSASELVEGSIAAGCVSYRTEIISVKCTYNVDNANCTCKEKRDGMEMTFKYELVKKEGSWFIANYQKDLGMDIGDKKNYDGTSSTKNTQIGDDEIVELDISSIEEEVMEIVYINDEAIADFAEVEPEFPGGDQALGEFIKKHIIYPEEAKQNGTQGTVYVQFVVNKDGSITDVIIIKSLSALLDAEAIRVVKSMPNWKPGQQAGKNIAVRYSLPIRFSL